MESHMESYQQPEPGGDGDYSPASHPSTPAMQRHKWPCATQSWGAHGGQHRVNGSTTGTQHARQEHKQELPDQSFPKCKEILMETPSSQSTPLGSLGHHPPLLAATDMGRQHSGLDPVSSSFPGSQEAGAKRAAAGGSSASLRFPATHGVGTVLTAFVAHEGANPLPSCQEQERKGTGEKRSREGAETGCGGRGAWMPSAGTALQPLPP